VAVATVKDRELDARQKPDCSPPGYPHSRLLVIVSWSVNWFACVHPSTFTSCRTPPSTEWHANPILCIEADNTNKNWLPRRPLRDRKTDFSSSVYSRSSTNPANLVEIGSVDVEIIGLT